MAAGTPREGLMAEYATPEALVAVVRRLHASGYRRVDAFTPYPVAGVEEALAIPRSSIPRWVLGAGLFGAAAAFLVQWWTNAVDYPILVGGRPLFSAPAWIPITFETAILCASLAAFLGLFAKARLPTLWHPVFEVEGFESAQVDGYWVMVGEDDPSFDAAATAAELERGGALRVVRVEAVS
jgi:hypothetical protein